MEEASAVNSTSNTSSADTHLVTHSLWEVITIATVSAIVSLITIVGNVLVMLSFKVNSQLKTVNNYYLLSLAAADLIIGVFSMNLYTSYILMGYWALGNLSCDLWLALDYVASNCVSHEPAGKRTVPERQCQIQFFSEPVITFGTAIAAFYIPVSVMTILYCRIYKETEKRTKDLAELQGINYTTDSVVPQPQKTIIRSCFNCQINSASRDTNQTSWSSSSRSNAAKSVASANDDWSKADQLTTFNSYASSEDEDRPGSPGGFQSSFRKQSCEASKSRVGSESEQLSSYEEDSYFQTPPKPQSQKSGKCVSYKFKSAAKDGAHAERQSKNGDTKMASSVFSSAESVNAPSASSTSKPSDATLKNQITKRKRMVLIKERKAAQTLSAILLAFILTWTPYNIMVLISTFCSDCIPLSLWHLGYWLCYVNSTVNPMCYALCNKTFQKTFRMLLLCQWKKKRIEEKLYWYGQNPAVTSKLT
ncbi:hypothetical protein fugu_016626 [Takifugu bimaculatus]|uniref:G-protein coupled receptors family 1 profile domain-containing protein n=1 Tax=Takifugu bimaculatus TaxID=433685 RepID=A0A4Z2BTI9_9TELE|nr:hypothetical protein fugu_016626 [Takifugu bimaculatus]